MTQMFFFFLSALKHMWKKLLKDAWLLYFSEVHPRLISALNFSMLIKPCQWRIKACGNSALNQIQQTWKIILMFSQLQRKVERLTCQILCVDSRWNNKSVTIKMGWKWFFFLKCFKNYGGFFCALLWSRDSEIAGF